MSSASGVSAVGAPVLGLAHVRQRDAAATRERLLAAAEAQFAAHGLAGSRVDEIARAAGVNVQLIYRYFGDKAGLHRAAFDRTLGRLARHLDGPLLDGGAGADPRAAFTHHIGRYLDFVWNDPTYARLGLWALAEGTDPHDGEHGSGLAELERQSEAAVASGIASGLLKPETAADLFCTTLISLSLGQFGLITTCGVCGGQSRLQAPGQRELLRDVVVGAMLGAFGR
ncbi:MAG TPA: TetR/AcrR family transcriptional regulator [Dehalococcoidia bacterium]|nr:TetR/AcrR family transcriptional regulator [Dehalococcoidia bacterium]